MGGGVYNDFVNLKRAQGQAPFVYIKDRYQLATTLLRTRCLGSASYMDLSLDTEIHRDMALLGQQGALASQLSSG